MGAPHRMDYLLREHAELRKLADPNRTVQKKRRLAAKRPAQKNRPLTCHMRLGLIQSFNEEGRIGLL